MIIPEHIKDFFENSKIMALATSDNNNTPNVVTIASKKILNNNTIITIDTFHKKTLENIKANNNVAIAMWEGSEGYQIKGKATIHTDGKIFEQGKKWILKSKPTKIVKGVIEIQVTDIYYLTPKYELAGEKI